MMILVFVSLLRFSNKFNTISNIAVIFVLLCIKPPVPPLLLAAELLSIVFFGLSAY